MPWSLLAGAIPYLIAAAIGARLAWGVQGMRIDELQADVELWKSATAKVEAERDNWRAVSAEQGAKVLEWQGAAGRAHKAAEAAKAASARRLAELADEIATLEASLQARGVLPVAEALATSRSATDALP